MSCPVRALHDICRNSNRLPGSWQSWINLLGNRDGATPTDALNIVTEIGFGTGSSALLALPAIEHADKQPVFLFADGRPDEVSYRSVADLRSAQDAAMQQFIV